MPFSAQCEQLRNLSKTNICDGVDKGLLSFIVRAMFARRVYLGKSVAPSHLPLS